MEQGYLPGLTIARIQEEAEWRFERGYTQDEIITDLKTLGLLDANGAPKPDSLRDNPCDSTYRDTVLPAGQRVITALADGDQTYTAWFCQSVGPSVTIIELDGTSSRATGAQLDQFAQAFRSSESTANCPIEGWYFPDTTAVLGTKGTGVPGYVIEGWKVDGIAHPSGAAVGADHRRRARRIRVALTVRVVCHKLTVRAEFGHTAYPLPNCPGVPATRGLYAQDTNVTVTAGESSGHVFEGGTRPGTRFNPTLAKMDKDVTLTAGFRAKTVGEQIQETVIDPALNALGVAAKKAVGGIAYVTKIFAQHVIDDVFLKTLSSIGSGLKLGFNAIGVEGVVLDGIVLGLQTP